MLQSSFLHIPGVGETTEWDLWEMGIHSWDDALEVGIWEESIARKLADGLELSREKLRERDALWFADRLPPSESWRLFRDFRSKAAYFDIETDGRTLAAGGAITTIALWDGSEIRTYVNGENLRDFRYDIEEFELLVTYNGKAFDVPVISEWFRIDLPIAHLDLRHVLHGLGIRGGLKGCEQFFGLDRGDLSGVDGYFAVLFWQDYCNNGFQASLDTLLAYNILDVVSLERLAVEAYNRKLEETPFADRYRLPLPEIPNELPFVPDLETVERIREVMISRHGKQFMKNR